MLEGFDPLIREWFEGRFGAVTEPQRRGWPEIRAARDVLISAPTGSGKTLAAFLICLDALVRRARAGELEDRIEAVYVSPLKALSNDVRKNLEIPLGEIRALAEERGVPLAEIRTAVRTGDTRAVGASSDAPQAAARAGHHARVALHPADRGQEQPHARDHANGRW